jgi:hypothetical protein
MGTLCGVPTTSMTQVALDPNRQTLIEAYLALDLDCGASPLAIRSRYEELQTRHRVDQYREGSPDHAQASARLAQIESAYRLIRRAPLEHDPTLEIIRNELAVQPAPLRLDRPVSVLTETLILMAGGAVFGLLLATVVGRTGIVAPWAAFVFLPIVLAFVFTTTSRRVKDLIWLLWWWI